MGTLATILKENWEWRNKIAHLSWFDLVKQSRGAVLSWAWLFVKPGIYIFCFWFALEIGLRVARDVGGTGDAPFFLWLCAGIIPWFFIQDMLGSGCDVLHRYSYLVNKIKFPLSAISTVYTGASMLVHLMLVVFLFIVYFTCGQPLDVHLLQIPVLIVLMFLFWNTFSILTSQLSGISKDFANLIHACRTPLFWLSGVIFDIATVPIAWVHSVMCFNPVSFFVTGYRAALFHRVWIWEENPQMCIGFAIIFVLQVFVMVLVYKRFNEEVADAL